MGIYASAGIGVLVAVLALYLGIKSRQRRSSNLSCHLENLQVRPGDALTGHVTASKSTIIEPNETFLVIECVGPKERGRPFPPVYFQKRQSINRQQFSEFALGLMRHDFELEMPCPHKGGDSFVCDADISIMTMPWRVPQRTETCDRYWRLRFVVEECGFAVSKFQTFELTDLVQKPD